MRRIVLLSLVTGISLFVINCGKPDNTAIGYWDKAIAVFSQSDYIGTIKQYEKLVKYYPDDSLAVSALFTIADIYKNNLNNPKKAIKVYAKIINKYKGTEWAPKASFMIGYTYANDIKDLKRAEKFYKSFIKKYPTNILVPSAEWELKNLGKSLEEIPELQVITQSDSVDQVSK
jgi:tetratricopeptide (TPR) repeat protein